MSDFLGAKPSVFPDLLTIPQHQLVIHTFQRCHHYHQLQRHFIMQNFPMHSMPLFGLYQCYQKQLTAFASLILTDVFPSSQYLYCDDEASSIFHSMISNFQSMPSFLSESMEEEFLCLSIWRNLT